MNKHFQQLDIDAAARPAAPVGGRDIRSGTDPTTIGFRAVKRAFDLLIAIAALPLIGSRP
jgi:hypothetical protein